MTARRGGDAFRLGTTSFIHPGTWLDNVRRLAPHFDDLELLLFESPGPGAFPDERERRGLLEAKLEHSISYSVHTPLDASLASFDEARRLASVDAVRRAIEVGSELQAESFVVHAYLGDCEGSLAPPCDHDAWRERAHRSLEAIARELKDPRRLAVESLDYDFELVWPVVEALNLSVALDVGHLRRDGRDELVALRRYRARTTIIQFHGTDPGSRDHRALSHYPRPHAERLLSELRRTGFDGVLTLEVFRPGDLAVSLDVLRELGVSAPSGEAIWPAHRKAPPDPLLPSE